MIDKPSINDYTIEELKEMGKIVNESFKSGVPIPPIVIINGVSMNITIEELSDKLNKN